MAVIHGIKLRTLAKGYFSELVEHFPALAHTVRSSTSENEKISYYGTAYTIDLLWDGTQLSAVLQVIRHETEEIGMGDGACDYDLYDHWYTVCPVDTVWSKEGDEALLAHLLASKWAPPVSDAVSYRADADDLSAEDGHLVLPEGMTELGDDLHVDGTITHLHLPSTLTDVRRLAVCFPALQAITVAEGNTAYTAQNGFLCSADRQTLIFCPAALDHAVVPEGITALADGVFARWSGHTVTLPDGLLTIGASSFADCTEVECITVPDSVRSIGRAAFARCEKLTEVHLPASLSDIAEEMFRGTRTLSRVNVPPHVTDMGYHAFSLTAIREITLPATFDSVGENAFWRCKTLTSVHFCGDAEILKEAFLDCTALEEVVIDGVLKGVGREAFENCTSLKTFDVHNKNRKEVMNVKFDFRAFCHCTSMEIFSIPRGVTVLGENAFEGCTALYRVYVPITLRDVQFYAFKQCASLLWMDFSGNREVPINLWSSAFADCTALTRVRITGDAEIGPDAFEGCTALETLRISGSLLRLGKGAIADCKNLTDFTVGR